MKKRVSVPNLQDASRLYSPYINQHTSGASSGMVRMDTILDALDQSSIASMEWPYVNYSTLNPAQIATNSENMPLYIQPLSTQESFAPQNVPRGNLNDTIDNPSAFNANNYYPQFPPKMYHHPEIDPVDISPYPYRQDTIMPNYLQHYTNQKDGQSNFDRRALNYTGGANDIKHCYGNDRFYRGNKNATMDDMKLCDGLGIITFDDHADDLLEDTDMSHEESSDETLAASDRDHTRESQEKYNCNAPPSLNAFEPKDEHKPADWSQNNLLSPPDSLTSTTRGTPISYGEHPTPHLYIEDAHIRQENLKDQNFFLGTAAENQTIPGADPSPSGDNEDDLDHDADQLSNHMKKKRRRTSPEQLRLLMNTYLHFPTPTTAMRQELANKLGMTPRAIQVWFQNRRAKDKMDQKRAEVYFNQSLISYFPPPPGYPAMMYGGPMPSPLGQAISPLCKSPSGGPIYANGEFLTWPSYPYPGPAEHTEKLSASAQPAQGTDPDSSVSGKEGSKNTSDCSRSSISQGMPNSPMTRSPGPIPFYSYAPGHPITPFPPDMDTSKYSYDMFPSGGYYVHMTDIVPSPSHVTSPQNGNQAPNASLPSSHSVPLLVPNHSLQGNLRPMNPSSGESIGSTIAFPHGHPYNHPMMPMYPNLPINPATAYYRSFSLPY